MNFSDGLTMLSVIFLAMVAISFLNEKVVKLPEEIGLLTIALCTSVVLIILETLGITSIIELDSILTKIDFNDVVLGGFICYLLFSGSAGIKLRDLTHDKYLIGSLAFVSTLLATFIYAGLTLLVVRVFGIEMNFIEACILGSIIAPTDPISAMSILNKVGLSKRISIIVEGESLFNDGIAVALFVTFTSINQNSSNIALEFVKTISWNVFGAMLVGVVVSFLLFKLFKATKQKHLEIIVSLSAV
ncbi:MAG: cation:proton antiporter, partial [Acidaminobacteraceae bacterium]